MDGVLNVLGVDFPVSLQDDFHGPDYPLKSLPFDVEQSRISLNK